MSLLLSTDLEPYLPTKLKVDFLIHTIHLQIKAEPLATFDLIFVPVKHSATLQRKLYLAQYDQLEPSRYLNL